ncbi:unnamed protein product [Sphagnum balticum]
MDERSEKKLRKVRGIYVKEKAAVQECVRLRAGKDKETKAMPRSAMAIVSSRGRLRTRLARSSSSSSFPSLLCATSCTF